MRGAVPRVPGLQTNKCQPGFHLYGAAAACSSGRAFAAAARAVAQAAAPEINAEIATITDGAVTTISQVARLLTWVREHGSVLGQLDRKSVGKELDRDDLLPAVRRALELRLGGAQAAVKKLDALLARARAGDDDRVRGAFRYHGASTGHWLVKVFSRRTSSGRSSTISSRRSPPLLLATTHTCAACIRSRSP